MGTSLPEALRPLIDIMRRHGATCSPSEFHAAINVTFHEFESEVYDQEHSDMWNSLPQEVKLLVGDCLRTAPELPSGLRVLDIGCGTGLASQCLLWSDLGRKIASIDLLDTSPAMLRQAIRRSARWGIPAETFNGLLEDLPAGRTYDVIITCSVLHHVPDLASFLAAVRRHQAPHGFFIHLQDPNGDHLSDPEFVQRKEEYARRRQVLQSLSRFNPSRVFGRLYREIAGAQSDHYVDKTNRTLIERGVITSPLSFQELYSITDIHVDEKGISICELSRWLPEYDRIAQRSYGFYGALSSMLPKRLKRQEEELSRENSMRGLHVGAVWRLR